MVSPNIILVQRERSLPIGLLVLISVKPDPFNENPDQFKSLNINCESLFVCISSSNCWKVP